MGLCNWLQFFVFISLTQMINITDKLELYRTEPLQWITATNVKWEQVANENEKTGIQISWVLSVASKV